MINLEWAKRYCCEDFSLIENYDKASKDLIETWDIHHRKEEEGYSVKELISLGLYYNRPSSELVFLTKSEHRSMHMKGNKHCLGKHLSDETKRKMSDANKGEKNPRSKPVYQIDKNTGEIIKIWPCTMEIQRQLGIYNGRISECCTGRRKSVCGYIWRYVNSESLM